MRIGPPRAYRWRLLWTLLISLLGVGSTVTVLSLAIAEDLPRDLASTPGTLSWAVTGAVLSQAICTSLFGKIGDVAGPRRVFLGAATVLAVVTPLSGLAWNAASLISLRIIGGAANGAALAAAAAMILRVFPADERARALGWYQSAMTLAPAVGLLVGGPVIEAVGWRAMFVLFTLVAWLGLALGAVIIRPMEPAAASTRIDLPGAALLSATVVSALVGIDLGSRRGWDDPLTLTLLLGAPVLAGSFAAVEARTAVPLIRLDYFRRRNYILPALVLTLGNYAYMGALVVAPLMFSRLLGWGLAAASGLLFIRPLSFSVCSAVGGYLHPRLGDRGVAVLGMSLLTTAMLLLGFGARAEQLGVIVAGLVLSGVALGLSSPGMSTTIANATDPADYGVATGMRGTMAQVGVTAGLQTMVIALGGRYTGDAFFASFLLGASAAAVGLVLAMFISERTRVGRQGAPVTGELATG